MLSKSVGTNIKEFRKAKGLSQDALAEALFVTRQTVSNYETGRSNPDLDTLQKIAEVLEVDLSWLLYGKPMDEEKKASKKKTVLLAIFFAVVCLVTIPLWVYTRELLRKAFMAAPHMMVRLLLMPATMGLLGALIVQLMDYFMTIGKRETKFLKIGRITTLSVLGFNLLIIIPYIIWLCFVMMELLTSHNVAMTFPYIPVYTEIFEFFYLLMYKYPYVYTLAGMTLWLFCPNRRVK